MNALLRRNTALALRDYYPFWKGRNERSRAGKLLLLCPSDECTIQMFFDDNILHSSAHIVDVRDVRTAQSIPFQVLASDTPISPLCCIWCG